MMLPPKLVVVAAVALFASTLGSGPAVPPQPALPGGQLAFGAFHARFVPDGTFVLEGDGWPTFKGTWKQEGAHVALLTPGMPDGCDKAGRYDAVVDGAHVSFTVVEDACTPRRMILHGSRWRPATEAEARPERRIVRTPADHPPSLPAGGTEAGSWPSFRGPHAAGVADHQNLPDRWDGKKGENVLWRTPIPGLAHSSPIVWGNRIFLTSAVSSDPKATFRPGLYGDGDASEDRSRQRWMIFAIDKRTGKIDLAARRLRRRADRQAPRQVDLRQRHACHRRPHRRRLVRFAGCPRLRRQRHTSCGKSISVGSTSAPTTFPTYEWGPASSPIIWNGLVILQCDTQADSFLLALSADTRRGGLEDRSRRASVVGHAERGDDLGRARCS